MAKTILRVREERLYFILERKEGSKWKIVNWFQPPGAFLSTDYKDEFRELMKPFGYDNFGYPRS